MPFTLEEVVPWGRSFDEYISMFALSGDDLGKNILGCSDGPASFNCMLTKRGGAVVSVDPIYQFSAEEISDGINATYDIVMAQTRQNLQEFVWTHIGSVDELGRVRTTAMRDFLEDCSGRTGVRLFATGHESGQRGEAVPWTAIAEGRRF